MVGLHTFPFERVPFIRTTLREIFRGGLVHPPVSEITRFWKNCLVMQGLDFLISFLNSWVGRFSISPSHEATIEEGKKEHLWNMNWSSSETSSNKGAHDANAIAIATQHGKKTNTICNIWYAFLPASSINFHIEALAPYPLYLGKQGTYYHKCPSEHLGMREWSSNVWIQFTGYQHVFLRSYPLRRDFGTFRGPAPHACCQSRFLTSLCQLDECWAKDRDIPSRNLEARLSLFVQQTWVLRASSVAEQLLLQLWSNPDAKMYLDTLGSKWLPKMFKE